MFADLFAPAVVPLAPGAVLLRGFALPRAEALLAGVAAVAALAPFRHMAMPGGRRIAAAMTNAGALGWTSDARGYAYRAADPESGRPWPPLPPGFAALAADAAAAAGYAGFAPDGCLLNRYAAGAAMGLHRDADEADLRQPIVSVSLGRSVRFAWGGLVRGDPVAHHRLDHGDVVVWGGAVRLAWHGVGRPLAAGADLAGGHRYNLTFRRAG